VPHPERVDPQAIAPAPPVARPVARNARPAGAWLVYAAVGLSCVVYLNVRTLLVPRFGEWYAADTHPAVVLQLRAWLSGRLAPIPHAASGAYDYVWGRGGMHSNFGLGLPILALPLHLVARVFGAPAFPDQLRFLVFYAVTASLFAWALHRASRSEPTARAASALVTVFVFVFPTFVGLLAARFLIYEQTIAVGALWSLLLLAGILWLVDRATTSRLILVCGAAGFAIFLRAPLAAYGLTTVALATVIAHRSGLPPRRLVAGVATAAFVTALYLVANFVRFGSPFEAGYSNIVSLTVVNRLTRWGLGFASTPLAAASKEMFATLFLLHPVTATIMTTTAEGIPAPVAAYAVGERWREYSSPTYDLWVFAVWAAAFGVVGWRVVRRRLWRAGRDLHEELATVIGLWALPPSVVLFFFYAKLGNLATRYVVDLYPACVAALVCVGMAIVDVARERAPRRVAAVQLALAAIAGLYLLLGARGWPHRLSHPVDRRILDARLALLDARSNTEPVPSTHIKWTDPHVPEPVYNHLSEWKADGSIQSGMIFAFPRTPCVTFTFRPAGKGGWTPAEDESFAGFRARADFDTLVSCGSPKGDAHTRRVTMCEPRPPRFVLDGMRLYATASLDANLHPIDRLKLARIDAAPACP
jgi:hypothetical protein